jgi:acyl-CoA reductase-like NAD-dependent aldehyde dehydrogenase
MCVPHFPILTAEATQNLLRINVVAPFDGKVIATTEAADRETIQQCLKIAYALYRDRKAWLPLDQRIVCLETFKQLMSTHQQELALEAAREGGKPLIDSAVEVARAIDGIALAIEILRQEGGRVIPMRYNAASAHRIAFTQKEPIGVVVAVSAFNHPVNLIIHQVVPAIAVGCPVIVKPATDTPLSCLRVVKLLHEAGMPKAWCQALVIPDNQVASQLVTDERVGFFSFIGSANVGWRLRSQLAPGARCSLEHGGVAPVIIAADARLDRAVPLLTKGGFYHAGQVCVSVQRIFVEKPRARDVAEALAAEARQLIIGDPTLKKTAVGPLIRPTEVERVASWVREAKAQGAQVLCGGNILSASCYECTVLYNPPLDAKVSVHEVFGPVVCVYAVDDLQQALDQANRLPFAFQASIFTQDIDRALQLSGEIDAATVMINDHTAFRVDGMPFAGLKHSGLGVGGIPYTMHDMQIEKMRVIYSEGIA